MSTVFRVCLLSVLGVISAAQATSPEYNASDSLRGLLNGKKAGLPLNGQIFAARNCSDIFILGDDSIPLETVVTEYGTTLDTMVPFCSVAPKQAFSPGQVISVKFNDISYEYVITNKEDTESPTAPELSFRTKSCVDISGDAMAFLVEDESGLRDVVQSKYCNKNAAERRVNISAIDEAGNRSTPQSILLQAAENFPLEQREPLGCSSTGSFSYPVFGILAVLLLLRRATRKLA